MNTLLVLTRKELLEQVRTHKLTVTAAVFLFFGLLSPLTAKMLPEMMKSFGQGMVLQIPTPTAIDALDQLIKNIAQFGLLAVVLTAMGAVAGERERGTAAMTLCKPVRRSTFLASKFLAYSFVLVVNMALAAVACYYYVAIIWQPFDALAYAGSTALLGLYLLVTLYLTILASSLFRRPLAAGGVAIGAIIILSIVGGLPVIGQYSPGALLAWCRAAVAGGEAGWPALAGSAAVVLVSVVLSWAVFRGKEL